MTEEQKQAIDGMSFDELLSCVLARREQEQKNKTDNSFLWIMLLFILLMIGRE